MPTPLGKAQTAAFVRAPRLAAALAALVLVAACAGAREPPPSPPQGAQPVTAVVERGDTLSGIARRHGVALAELAAANGLAPPYRIHPGQVLQIPGSASPDRPGEPLRGGGQVVHIPGATPAPGPRAGGSALGTAAVLPPPVPVVAMPGAGAPVAAAPPPLPAGPAQPAPLPAEARAVIAEPLPLPQPTSEPAPAPSRQASLPATPPPPSAEAPAARPPLERPAAAPPRRQAPGRFAWPVRGQVVSTFGAKGGGLVNDGMNIAAPRGTPVRAAADGTVIYAGNEVRGFGNLVLIRHEGGWVTAYGHAERVLVRQGQAVRAGEEIARVGSSGAVTTPQLHFQVRRDGRPVDPALHLERAVANRAS